MSLPELFANSSIPGEVVPIATLSASITAEQTTITVSSVPPANLQNPGQFRILIGHEIILVTGGNNSTTWNVIRGSEGSEAQIHSIDSPIYHIMTTGGFEAAFPKIQSNGKVNNSVLPEFATPANIEAEKDRAEAAEALKANKSELGTAAYQPTTAFDSAGSANTVKTEVETFATTKVEEEKDRATMAESERALKTELELKASKIELEEEKTRAEAAEGERALITELETVSSEVNEKASKVELTTEKTRAETAENTKSSKTELEAERERAETSENTKAPIASPSFTGTPTAPTPSETTSSTQIATTAFTHAVATTAKNAAEAASIPLTQKGAAGGVAELTSGGVLPSAQLPPLALTEAFVVNSEEEQLALNAHLGDFAIRSDLGKTFVHNSGTTGTMSDWTEIVTPGQVLSVNGQTGTVSITAANIGAATPSEVEVKASKTELSSERSRAEEAENTKSTKVELEEEITRAQTAENEALKKADNLSDLANASTARTNLGLGTAAIENSTAFDTAGSAETAQHAAETASIPLVQKGAHEGVATLNNEGIIPLEEIPSLPAAKIDNESLTKDKFVAEVQEELTSITTKASKTELEAKASLDSPEFTGIPTGPIPIELSESSQQLAIVGEVISYNEARRTEIVAEKSRAEAAEALKAPLESPTLTGEPTAPTADESTNNTQIATTAFVQTAISNKSYTFNTPYAWAIAGEVEAGTLPGITIVPAAGETVHAIRIDYKIIEGTKVVFSIHKNGSALTGFTELEASTTATHITPTAVSIASGEELTLIISSVEGSPKGFSATIQLQQVI